MINSPRTTLKQSYPKKKIAIIGSGVSGLTCAHYLVADHDVTIFETNNYLGGHANTVDIEIEDKKSVFSRLTKKQQIEKSSIDTGFVVFNDKTYPNFFRLLDELDVPIQKSEMSFSILNKKLNLEYNGHSLNILLSKRSNVASPKFWRLAKDIVEFNRGVKQLNCQYQKIKSDLDNLNKLKAPTLAQYQQLEKNHLKLNRLMHQTLGDYLAKHGFGKLFASHYLIPMISAIWSMGLHNCKTFPLVFFARFFEQHGLLEMVDRPQWFTIANGSKQYVNRLIKRYAELGGKAYVNTVVQAVTREDAGVLIEFLSVNQCGYNSNSNNINSNNNPPNNNHTSINDKYSSKSNRNKRSNLLAFDEVIFACHADVAKRILTDIDDTESSVLGSFTFTNSLAVLHTDSSILPKKVSGWASLNYISTDTDNLSAADNQQTLIPKILADPKPVLTYHMNILQRLTKSHNYLVTLNKEIDKRQVITSIDYRHPIFNKKTVHAQESWDLISGLKHTHYCGAYWFNGFHEDGVKSGVKVCQTLGVDIELLTTMKAKYLNNIMSVNINDNYTVKQLPVGADLSSYKLKKRRVLSVANNTRLNAWFE